MSLVDFAASSPRPAGNSQPTSPLGIGLGKPAAAPAANSTASDEAAGGRTLTVGEGLALSGTISSCDRLIVAGTIKADIAGCRDLRVDQTGLFSGSAEIKFAEISGRFEGKLDVTGRLKIRATGKVTGNVKCAELEIERGGEISGNIEMRVG